MNLPLILVNFKIYEEGTGEKAIELAKIHQKVAQETNANIVIAVNALDLVNVINNVDIPVFAQHIDPCVYGSGTGKICPAQLTSLGVFGTLLNHSEYSLENEIIMKSVKMCKEEGLFTIVCADTPERASEILKFNPDLIAVEPPELIGGDKSVSKTNPEVIGKSVSLIGQNKVLVGAGIKDGEDTKIALSLGACGILVASGVVKADDPYSALLDLVSGMK